MYIRKLGDEYVTSSKYVISAFEVCVAGGLGDSRSELDSAMSAQLLAHP